MSAPLSTMMATQIRSLIPETVGEKGHHRTKGLGQLGHAGCELTDDLQMQPDQEAAVVGGPPAQGRSQLAILVRQAHPNKDGPRTLLVYAWRRGASGGLVFEVLGDLSMGVGRSGEQGHFDDAALVLGGRLEAGSLCRLLADEGRRLFGDDCFADLCAPTHRGRPTIPARVVATVMLLASHERLSEREALGRLELVLRWSAAAGSTVAHPMVLVGLPNRLRASGRPRRLLQDVDVAAKAAGLLGSRVRVLGSTPMLGAVATQDTLTQLRPVAGMTAPPRRSPPARWSSTLLRRWALLRVNRWGRWWVRRPSCWRWSPARTSDRVRTVGSGPPARSPGTG